MSDIQEWLEERETIWTATTECWTHDEEEDGGNFWAGGGRSDFHLTVADATFCVDAHNVAVPKLLAGVKAVLETASRNDLTSYTQIMEDGYPSVIIRSSEEIGQLFIDALWEAINDDE